MSKLPAERRIKAAVTGLMRNQKFSDWSGILMLGTKTVDDNIPTACTNGRDEIYGRKFVDGLLNEELAFVILHEAGHKLLRQLTVWNKLWKEDPRLANISMDHVVNLMLIERDPNGVWIKMPEVTDPKTGKKVKMGCADPRFSGMNTKQVFDILKKEQQQGGGGKGSGQPQPGSGQPGGDPGDGPMDDHDWEGAQGLTPEEKKVLEQEIDRAVRQGQIVANKMCGKDGVSGNRELSDLLEAKVNWRDELRQFVTNVCPSKDTASWRRPNRRLIGQDIYLPSLIGERVGEVVIGVDTSGSIGQAELTRAMTETSSIVDTVRPSLIHVIYWDHSVAAHETYDATNMALLASTTKPRGGGGTNPRVMEQYLLDKKINPMVILQFTDGCIGQNDWGNRWTAPIIWGIIGSWARGKAAPCGKTIHLDDL